MAETIKMVTRSTNANLTAKFLSLWQNRIEYQGFHTLSEMVEFMIDNKEQLDIIETKAQSFHPTNWDEDIDNGKLDFDKISEYWNQAAQQLDSPEQHS